jgi:hypothetical protein
MTRVKADMMISRHAGSDGLKPHTRMDGIENNKFVTEYFLLSCRPLLGHTIPQGPYKKTVEC